MTHSADNFLYYGDNLDILQRYVKDESVDLVYLDPPFKSNATYNVLFAEKDGSQAASQIQAFEDTWRWDQAAAAAYQKVVEQGGAPSRTMQAFRQLLGDNDMLAYLAMMAPRLIELRRVLKGTGSIYLHCDPTASHYLKLLMDAVFGPINFQGEIIWRRTASHVTGKRWGRLHDVILAFAKEMRVVKFAPQRVAADEGWIAREYRHQDDRGRYMVDNLTGAGTVKGPSGQPWRGIDPKEIGAGRHWRYSPEKLDQLDAEGRIYWPPKGKYPKLKQYIHESGGKAVGDIWTDISVIGRTSGERLGYPTQKPEALLERIIMAGSDEGDVVLDPFCGCGTTIAVAERLKRRWIGIDITHVAVHLMKHRLKDTFGEEVTSAYKTVGEPVSITDAQALALQDRFQFECWALGLVGARRDDKKRGADRGIDGRLYFHDDNGEGKTKQVILSVKSGKTNVTDIRELGNVLDRENAEIGVLITMQEPTKPMRAEAAGAGYYESPWGQHPRLQILTVEELLEGRAIDMPPVRQVSRTFKKAPKAKRQAPEQDELSS